MINASDINASLVQISDVNKVSIPMVSKASLNNIEKLNIPVVYIEFMYPKLPVYDENSIKIIKENEKIFVTANFLDMGVGDISRCGFIVSTKNNYIEDGPDNVFYEAKIIPIEVNQPVTAVIKNMHGQIVYIAAFAENQAGRALSKFVSYRDSTGWEGGMLLGLKPNCINQFIVGGTAIHRSKIANIYIGTTKL